MKQFDWIPWLPLLFRAARVALILAGSYFAVRAIVRLIPALRARTVERMSARGAATTNHEMEKRARTISGILVKLATVIIWVVAIMMSLKELGFDLAPILAGAGIVGLAVGFGAQNLVRDVISGFFILLENQVRVNDLAVVNGTAGIVEEINLRTIALRSQDGAMHIFPNGTITTMSNKTMGYSYYVFEVSVAYKEDTDHVVETLGKLGEEMRADPQYREMILEPLEILGVDKLADSAVVVTARFKTEPLQQYEVGREMNRRIKKRFDELHIQFPSPTVSVDVGALSKALQLGGTAAADDLRAAVRDAVREVVREELASGAFVPVAKSVSK